MYLGEFIDSSKFVDQMHDNHAWMQASKALDNSLSGVIVGQYDQLKTDVVLHYKGTSEEATIQSIVNSQCSPIGTKDDLGHVWRFLQLSSLLPRTKRRRLFPTSSSGHFGYVCLTEEMLFRMLARGSGSVTLNNVTFSEEDIEHRQGFFLYSLLSFEPSGLNEVTLRLLPPNGRPRPGLSENLCLCIRRLKVLLMVRSLKQLHGQLILM